MFHSFSTRCRCQKNRETENDNTREQNDSRSKNSLKLMTSNVCSKCHQFSQSADFVNLIDKLRELMCEISQRKSKLIPPLAATGQMNLNEIAEIRILLTPCSFRSRCIISSIPMDWILTINQIADNFRWQWNKPYEWKQDFRDGREAKSSILSDRASLARLYIYLFILGWSLTVWLCAFDGEEGAKKNTQKINTNIRLFDWHARMEKHI